MFFLAAALLVLFAAPATWATGPRCFRPAAARRVVSCHSAPSDAPCGCPWRADCAADTTLEESLTSPARRHSQNDAMLRCPADSGSLRLAHDLVAVSGHGLQPATALERCVRFSRLTL